MCEDPRSHMFSANLSFSAPQAAALVIRSNSSEFQGTLDPPTCLSKPFSTWPQVCCEETLQGWVGATDQLSRSSSTCSHVHDHHVKRDNHQQGKLCFTEPTLWHYTFSQTTRRPPSIRWRLFIEVLCKLCPSPWGKAAQLVPFFLLHCWLFLNFSLSQMFARNRLSEKKGGFQGNTLHTFIFKPLFLTLAGFFKKDMELENAIWFFIYFLLQISFTVQLKCFTSYFFSMKTVQLNFFLKSGVNWQSDFPVQIHWYKCSVWRVALSPIVGGVYLKSARGFFVSFTFELATLT